MRLHFKEDPGEWRKAALLGLIVYWTRRR